MARFVTVQTNFTTGELDPLLRARIDLKSTSSPICSPSSASAPENINSFASSFEFASTTY